MKSISTIEDIRKTRKEISRKCDFDPKKLVSFYMERQKKYMPTSQSSGHEASSRR